MLRFMLISSVRPPSVLRPEHQLTWTPATTLPSDGIEVPGAGPMAAQMHVLLLMEGEALHMLRKRNKMI